MQPEEDFLGNNLTLMAGQYVATHMQWDYHTIKQCMLSLLLRAHNIIAYHNVQWDILKIHSPNFGKSLQNHIAWPIRELLANHFGNFKLAIKMLNWDYPCGDFRNFLSVLLCYNTLDLLETNEVIVHYTITISPV